ncbi:MAG: family B DNA polymerase [Candidatus Aenigmatarchaeota archaeon]
MKMQILDADYKMVNNKPVVRLFGKTEDGETVCALDNSFRPYFYCLPENHNGSKEEILELIEDEYEGAVEKIGEVERYTPIGYDDEKKKILKIVLRNPSTVREMREYLRDKGPVKNLYETDILFKYRYIIDNDLGGMHWVEVDGKYVDTEIVNCKAVEVENIEPIEARKNANLKYLSFDIECIAQEEGRMVDADKDPIVLISCSFSPEHKGQKNMVLVAKPGSTTGRHFENEEEMLEEFLDIINEYDPDVITGYNVEDFDLSYLVKRLDKHDLRKDFGRCEKNVYCNTYGNSTDVKITGRVIADPYTILKNDVYHRMMRYDLDSVSEELLGENKEDVEYEEMKELWNSSGEDLQRFIDYCEKDAELALRLLLEQSLLDKFFELAKISRLVLSDCFGGQTQRISNMLLYEFRERDFVFPEKPSDEEMERRNERRKEEALKGGLVLEPDKGLHTESCIAVLDFKSLYPSIMSTYNICPTTLLLEDLDEYDLDEDDVNESPTGGYFVNRDVRKGILAKTVEDLIDARTEVKKERAKAKEGGNEKEYNRLDAKQLAIKIMTNSFYGYTGYYRTRLYRLEIANAITAWGRVTIEKTRDMIEDEYGYRTVYGDTDSVMIDAETKNLDEAHKISQEISQFITDELPRRLILEPEKIYRSFLILTKKRYAGWKFEKSGDDWEEGIDMKGIETVRRDWPEIVSDTMEDVIDIILKEGDINKAIDHVKEIIQKISNREVSLEKLQVVKSITKKIDSYDGVLPHIELAKKMEKRDPSNAPTPGQRIPYVIIEGNQMISKRVEDPDYIRENNLKVDTDYYINSQLLPPLERIFNVIGVDKQELLGDGRQATMDEIVNGSTVNRDRDVSVNKDPDDTTVEELNGFQCKDCKKDFRRVPLKGRCSCGGDVYIVGNGSIGKKVNMDD